MKDRMKVVTHDDRFHADDIFGVATLQLVFGVDALEIIRTRDKKLIAAADIVLDVGGEYDPERGRFDHHQPGGAGERGSGIQYASFGLIWKKYGEQLAGSKEAAESIDSWLVQAVDAGDNGIAVAKPIEGMPSEYVINMVAGVFGPTWEEDESVLDTNFTYMTSFARELLKREIAHAQARVHAVPLIAEAYEKAQDKRILVLDGYYPWMSAVKEFPEVLFVVSPNKEGNKWRTNAVQEELFVNKKSLPQEWAGLKDGELQKMSGVADAVFCHRALFMAAAGSREGAVELAQKALAQ
jgi:uncharacterized UPF0160 family protein